MKDQKKNRRIYPLVLVAVVSMLAGILFASGFDLTEETSAQSFWRDGKAAGSPPVVAPGTLPSFVGLAKNLAPSVVNISTTQTVQRREGSRPQMPPPELRGPFGEFFGDDFFERFFGDQQRELDRHSLGSGFIINKEGYILTNHHVIDNASEIIVTLSDDKTEYTAEVIGKDQKLDIALIKIDARTELSALPLGDSDALSIGEWVLAIGNPFGLGGTVTAGIISQKGRVIGAGPYDNFLQTDASINPGNSGGPLFNLDGEVIGINTAIVAGGQGIGFATPINIVKNVLVQLKSDGTITRGWIGVSIQELTPELSEHFGLKENKGALIGAVTPGDPADRGGMIAGDIIVNFDGKPIDDLIELPRAVAATAPGTKVKVIVIRDGKKKELAITVGKKEDDTELAGRETDQKTELPETTLGITVKPITPTLAERFGLTGREKGVIISAITPGSPAQMAGLRGGDIIKEINRRPIYDFNDYKEAANFKKGQRILLLILRGKSTFYVSIHIDDGGE